jgi:hypothetical protein
LEPQDNAEVRRPALFCAGGAAVAVASIPVAGVAGPPYLSLSDLSPWLVVYAIGLFTALFATPFAIHATLGGQLEADARWERALVLWGAVALVALALGLLIGLPTGFDSDSLAGSLAGVTVAEAVLVIGALLAWLLAN